MASLPLLAFQHHVGSLLVDPGEIEYVSELGQGALGLVEKGRYHLGGKVTPVVVKSYKPGVVASPEDFRELLMEAGKLARLTHPHIPRFYGLGCYDHSTLAAVRSSLFCVEEFVGTRSLRRLLAEQMRSPSSLYDMAWALRWASQVAEALAFLHSRSPQYIHGDVTADNVFLEDHRHLEAAEVKLGDLKPHRHIYEKYVSLGSVAGPAAQPFPATSLAAPSANGAPIEQYSLSRYSLQPHGSATASGAANGGGSGGSAPGPLSSRGSGQQQGGSLAAAAAGGARTGGGGGLGGMPTLHTIRSDPMAIGGGSGGPSGYPRRGGNAAASLLGNTGPLTGPLAAQSPSESSYSDAVAAADSSSGLLDPRGSTPLERFLITGVDDGAERGKKGGGVRWGPGVGGGAAGGASGAAGRPAAGPLNTAAAVERGLMRMSRSLPGPSMLGSLLGDEEEDEGAGAGEDEPRDGSSGGGARRRAARRSEAGRGARGDAAGGCPAPPVPIPGAGRPPRLGVASSGSTLLGPLGSGGGSGGTALSGSGGSGGNGGATSPPALSWDLSPSGAGVPSGSMQTSLLDLFADVRGPQAEGPASLALSGGGAGPPPPPPAAPTAPRGGIASALAAPSAAARGGGGGGGSGPTAPSAFASHDAAGGGGNGAPPLPPLPPGVAAARAAGGGNSSSELSEFKTHGSCSAFAALTAIDAIAEDDCEGSSHGRARRAGAASTLQHSGSASSGGLYSASGGSFHGGVGATGGGGGSLSTVSTGGDEPSRGSKRLRLPLSDKGAAGAVTSRDRGLLYTAPELLRGERPTEKVDVFSFGVLLYELLSRSLLLAWRLPQPPRASPGAPPGVAAAAAAAAAAYGSYSPHSTASGGGGGGNAAAAAAPTGAAATLAAAAAAAAAMADHSVSRSGRWAAAAATVQQQRNAGADAAQMLAYAARVAEGYRPPLPPFWPPAVADLVTRCCAQEPHERPRMTDVLRMLRAISEDLKAVAKINSYVNTDVGFMPSWLDPTCPDAAAAVTGEGSGKGSSGGSRLARQRSGGSGGSSAAGGRSQRGSGAALSGLGAATPRKAAAAAANAPAPRPEGACCSIC